MKNKRKKFAEKTLFDEDLVETKVVKTYHHTEKRKDSKTKDLSCALWFIDKVGDLARAEKVFKAALAAQKELK